ncbi:MAG: type II secretion system secretin GspD [Myxococcales bacterium]|nr:type II secretion system secretin GspD [Myxococcales bacterium]
MNSTVRHSLPFVLALGLIAAPALAQDPPEKTPVVREGGIKSLKPAALPAPKVKQPERPLKATPKVKDRPGADDDAPPGSPTSRRPAPGAAPTTGAGPAPRNEELPAWQQVDESDDEPTLSKDFIRNCARLKPGVKVNLDIYDEDLEAVVKLIACLTGQNIILAKSLKGKKITIYSPKKVTAREAYRAFLTALEANGYTISKQGNFLRIIEIKDFATSADPILPPDRDLANEDQMVTQILQLRHIDAGELNDVLSKLASPNAQFIVYQPTNSLIVTELSSNLRKLKTLIAELDVPGGQEELWVYQVLNADAADIASKITEIFEQEAAGSSPAANARSRPRAAAANAQKAPATATSATVGESELDAKVGKVIADERTNRLLIVASRRSYRKIKSLIEKLDIAIPGDGQIHILQLNNAKAADLASTLSNLSNEARNQRQAQNRRTPVRQARGGAAAGAAAGGDSAALFEGDVSITADENTNALVITASLKDFLALKSVVDELDRPRRQVFIEAVIMEVTINGSREFGLNSHLIFEGPSVAGEKTALAFNNQVDSEVNSLDLVGSAAALSGIGMTSLGGDAAGLPIPPFGVILNAIARSDDVNVLSAPHILTTDNEEAEIVVGSNVPFLQSATGGLGGGLGGVTSSLLNGGLDATGALGGLGGASSLLGGLYNPTTITREDVALTLRITPRISAENQVTLEIDQEIEEVAGTSDLGPTTTKRSIKTNIIVGDQKTIVIGGLQKNKQTSSHNGVPILSEIPVLGYFFRRTSNSNERVNLLLMLTPYVIEGPEDFREIFLRKMEEHREFVSRFHKKGDQYVLGIDYGKKHGMLESINQSMSRLREEQELIEELRRREQGPPLPQELDGLDDPEAAGAGGPPPARTIAVAPAAPALDVAPVPAELGDDGDVPEEADLP